MSTAPDRNERTQPRPAGNARRARFVGFGLLLALVLASTTGCGQRVRVGRELADGLAYNLSQLCEEFIIEDRGDDCLDRTPLNYCLVIQGYDPLQAYVYTNNEETSSLVRARAYALASLAEGRYKSRIGVLQCDGKEEEGSLWLMRYNRVVGFAGIVVWRPDWGEPSARRLKTVYDSFSNGLVRSAFERFQRQQRELTSAPTPACATEMIEEMIHAHDPYNNMGPAAYAIADEFGEVIKTGGELWYGERQLGWAARLAIAAFEIGTDPVRGQHQLEDEDDSDLWYDGGVGVYNVGAKNYQYLDHHLAMIGAAHYPCR